MKWRCFNGNDKRNNTARQCGSLLKFGPNSTRYKDVFDMFYLLDKVDKRKLLKCLNTLIIFDIGMKEDNIDAIVRRLTKTFSSKSYIDRLTNSKKNWIDEEIPTIILRLINFLKMLDL